MQLASVGRDVILPLDLRRGLRTPDFRTKPSRSAAYVTSHPTPTQPDPVPGPHQAPVERYGAEEGLVAVRLAERGARAGARSRGGCGRRRARAGRRSRHRAAFGGRLGRPRGGRRRRRCRSTLSAAARAGWRDRWRPRPGRGSTSASVSAAATTCDSRRTRSTSAGAATALGVALDVDRGDPGRGDAEVVDGRPGCGDDKVVKDHRASAAHRLGQALLDAHRAARRQPGADARRQPLSARPPWRRRSYAGADPMSGSDSLSTVPPSAETPSTFTRTHQTSRHAPAARQARSRRTATLTS